MFLTVLGFAVILRTILRTFRLINGGKFKLVELSLKDKFVNPIKLFWFCGME